MDIDTFLAYKEMEKERENLISSKYPKIVPCPIERMNERTVSLCKKLRELNTDILPNVLRLGIRVDIYLPEKHIIIRYVDMEDKISQKRAKLLYKRSWDSYFPNALVFYRSTETEDFVLEKVINTLINQQMRSQKSVSRKPSKVTDCNHSESVQKSAEEK